MARDQRWVLFSNIATITKHFKIVMIVPYRSLNSTAQPVAVADPLKQSRTRSARATISPSVDVRMARSTLLDPGITLFALALPQTTDVLIFQTGIKTSLPVRAFGILFLVCLWFYYHLENRRGDAVYGPSTQITTRDILQAGLEGKTDREIEIFRYVLKGHCGYSNRPLLYGLSKLSSNYFPCVFSNQETHFPTKAYRSASWVDLIPGQHGC